MKYYILPGLLLDFPSLSISKVFRRVEALVSSSEFFKLPSTVVSSFIKRRRNGLTGLLVLPICLCSSSCISAWMAAGTGVNIDSGTDREEIHQILGKPVGTGDPADFNFRTADDKKKPVSIVDVHLFRGKVNSVAEGSELAMLNAYTLGTGEVYMIPFTIYDIVARSSENHRIEVAYDADFHVLGYEDTTIPKE